MYVERLLSLFGELSLLMQIGHEQANVARICHFFVENVVFLKFFDDICNIITQPRCVNLII